MATLPLDKTSKVVYIDKMPIFEYMCRDGHTTERISNKCDRKVIKCSCGSLAVLVPSVPGYRRDHTMVNDKPWRKALE